MEFNSRCNILPDVRFTELGGLLMERLAKVGALIEPQNFASLLDPLMREVLQQGFAEAGAQEGTIWLMDATSQYLIPAYNTGPNAHKLVGEVRLPLNAGLISMVLASEQPFVENQVHKNSRRSTLLDDLLQVQTYALIAVPFYLLKRCYGVVSCVQLKSPGSAQADPPGFAPDHLSSVQRAASILTRLLEYRLLSSTVGWAAD